MSNASQGTMEREAAALKAAGWTLGAVRGAVQDMDAQLKQHFEVCELCVSFGDEEQDDENYREALCPIGRRLRQAANERLANLLALGVEDLMKKEPPLRRGKS